MWSEVLKVVGLLALSGTKFLMAPGAILAAGYSLPITVLISFVGGTLGALFFFLAGSGFFRWLERIYPPSPKKRTFTRKNRLIVRFKNRFGVIGLALLIPLISIPVSTIIAAKYFRYDRKSIPAYLGAVAFWSIVLTYFSQPIVSWVKQLF